MSLRSDLNGEFDSAALERLSWPIAWSGTVSEEGRRQEESELSEFIEEAREAIQQALPADGYAVDVKNGQIVGVLCGTQD